MSLFSPPARFARWINIKTGKTCEGWWQYLRGAERFDVQIKGLKRQRFAGETPEYGNWRLIRAQSSYATVAQTARAGES